MNENKQKEIEEMAKDIEKYVVRDWSKVLYIGSAEALYNAGYRNAKDKVVLSKEEYEELRQERSDYITELQETHNENCRLRIKLEDIRKETARQILSRAKNKMKKVDGAIALNYAIAVIEELAKEYGVEVER